MPPAGAQESSESKREYAMSSLLKWAIVLVLVIVAAFIASKRGPSSTSSGPRSPRPQTPIRPALTIAQLEQTSDDQLEYFIFGAQLDAMKDHYDWAYEIVSEWTPGMQMLYTTWLLEGEVNNGGFNQYFWNTEGKTADMALAGYRLVGAEAYADVVRRAIATQKEEAEMMQEFKAKGTLEAFSESYEHTKLSSLDEEFYDLQEDVSALRVKYIRSHLGEFATE
jgi:hypothetical protein